MIIRKFVSGIIAFCLLIATFNILYNSFPTSPVKMIMSEANSQTDSLVKYDAVAPMFAENLRFSNSTLTYYIEYTCNEKRKNSMREAFRLFQREINIISFKEVSSPQADIFVGCSEDFIKLGDNLFAAGEGGPSQIINTSEYKTITQGKIYLYEDTKCVYPVVEIHELLHVFGFDHSVDPSSILYNISQCEQIIPIEVINKITDLYSIKSLPDIYIEDIKAVKKGRYLDFNLTVLNGGLKSVDKVSLSILEGSQIVETIELKEMKIGYGRTIEATNIRLPSQDIKTIKFILDYNGEIKEINKENNEVELVVEENSE